LELAVAIVERRGMKSDDLPTVADFLLYVYIVHERNM